MRDFPGYKTGELVSVTYNLRVGPGFVFGRPLARRPQWCLLKVTSKNATPSLLRAVVHGVLEQQDYCQTHLDMQPVIGNLIHSSPNVEIYLTSQPRYTAGHLCTNLATFAITSGITARRYRYSDLLGRSSTAGRRRARTRHPCSITAERHRHANQTGRTIPGHIHHQGIRGCRPPTADHLFGLPSTYDDVGGGGWRWEEGGGGGDIWWLTPSSRVRYPVTATDRQLRHRSSPSWRAIAPMTRCSPRKLVGPLTADAAGWWTRSTGR